MALVFPLALDQFFNGLRINLAEMDQTDGMIMSQTRGGQIIPADIANRLWRGKAGLVTSYHDDADAIRAKLAVLRSAAASFFVRPMHRIGPIADPFGTILGAAAPTISALPVNNRQLSITGLPVGYVISSGDYLSFSYGSNPVRYGFHHVVTGAVASGAGVAANIEVTPNIQPGAVTGAAVRLVRPYFKAHMAQTPSYGGLAPVFTSGMGFDFIQTLG